MGGGTSVVIVHNGFPELYKQSYEDFLTQGKSIEEALTLALKEPAPQKLYINLVYLEHAIKNALDSGKTPLIIDSSEDDKVNTYFMYTSAVLFDGKKAGLDKSLRNVPVTDIMERARNSLVQSIKYGNTFVIALTKSVTDFATTFNDDTSPHPQGREFVYPDIRK